MFTQKQRDFINKTFEESRNKPNPKCPICNKLVMNKINSRMIVHPMVEVQLGLKPQFEYMCYRCADKSGAVPA
jgi:DNA-directed RNA polymerase subunit RPC12/RpoP